MACDLDGLSGEWDAIPSIRQRMREGGVLIAEVPDKNVDLKTTSKYNDVLAPVLKRMREVANRKLPAIEFIREEVFKLLQLSKREPEEKHVIEFSRVIRKNLSFVKMKARRNEPSEVACHALARESIMSILTT